MIKRQINIMKMAIVVKLKFIVMFLKKLMLNFEDFIDNTIDEDSIIKEGKQIIDRITKDKNNFFVFCPTSNGDIIFVSSLLTNLSQKKDYYLVLGLNQEFFSKLFSYIKGSVLVSKTDMNKIIYYFQRTGKFKGDNYLYAFVRQGMNKHGNINHFDTDWDCSKVLSHRYKESVFKCNIDSSISNITYKIDNKKSRNICKKNDINNMSIVIMPISNSELCLSKSFWNKLIRVLNEKGYSVYTNIGKNELPLDNTKPLALSFEDLFCIANKVKMFISVRSGICDLLALTSAKQIVINSSKNNYYKWDNVNSLDPQENAKNIYVSWKSDKRIIENILKLIEGKEKK